MRAGKEIVVEASFCAGSGCWNLQRGWLCGCGEEDVIGIHGNCGERGWTFGIVGVWSEENCNRMHLLFLCCGASSEDILILLIVVWRSEICC